jgi:hypothetical protein
MPGYISEGIRYFRVAEKHCDLNEGERERAFVPIVFSAMYVESVVNEVIFTDQLSARNYEEALGKTKVAIELDIYNEYASFESKTHMIFNRYGVTGYEQDKEFIELLHLMALRGFLVHLKPVEQVPGGEPERKICRAALNYLHKNVKIIDDPFGKGVFWTDVLMRKDVAEWAVLTAKNSIEWLYHKTYSPPFGNDALQWHCQLLGIRV